MPKDTSQEETQVDVPDPQKESQAIAPDPEALSALEARISRLEAMAHTEHAMDVGGLEALFTHFKEQAAAHVLKTLGHSGKPSA